MSKPSSAKAYGIPRKSRWNKDLVERRPATLRCQVCTLPRRRFLKGTMICGKCAMKIATKVKPKEVVKL